MSETIAADHGPSRSGSGLALSVLVFLGESWGLALQALAHLARARVSAEQTLRQMAAMGVDSLPIVMVTTFSTGAVFAYYVADIFVQRGAGALVGGALTLSFVLELGPVLAGVMVAARSGAAIAAEIGSMVVTEQVDALRALAVSPVRYLVAPRLLAALLIMPIVGVFADLAGIYGCYVMAGAHGVTPQAFLESTRSMVTEVDFLKGLVKAEWFGFTVAVVACQQGLRTRGGATGVGRATTSSVVLCVVLIFIADFFLAPILAGATKAGS